MHLAGVRAAAGRKGADGHLGRAVADAERAAGGAGGSDLFEDTASRRGVLARAVPRTLVERVGVEAVMGRLPEPYQRALFSSWVASHFVSGFFFLSFGCDVM